VLLNLLHAIAELAVATMIFVYGTAFIINLATTSGVYFTGITGNAQPMAGPGREIYFVRCFRRGLVAAGIFVAVTLPIALAIKFA
jgi:hypothetical protein